MQAAFTTKELRELTKLGIAELVVWRHELERGLTNASQTELKKGRAQKRMAKILDGAVRDFEARSNGGSSSIERRVVLRFLQSPVALIESEQHPGRVGAVTLQPNQLEGEAGPIHTTRPYIYIYVYIYIFKKRGTQHHRGAMPTSNMFMGLALPEALLLFIGDCGTERQGPCFGWG